MKTIVACVVASALSATTFAQAPQPPAAPPQPPGVQGERPVPPPPPPAPPPPSERRPLPTRNVKVDVTITDQTGGATPTRKVVSLIVADGRSSSVRSLTQVPVLGREPRDLPLHVDANVTITPEARVLLELRFTYSGTSIMTPVGSDAVPPGTTEAERLAVRDQQAPRPAFATVTENLTALLSPGSPVVVARSADPSSERTVTVEVTAEILK